MNKELFEDKISKLSDQKLQELLKFRGKENISIVVLAIEEAQRRNIDVGDARIIIEQEVNKKMGDMTKLDKWNWAPLLFGPVWTVANKLDKWTVLYFIPPVNIIIALYLGSNGNRLAFEKSNIDSIDNFVAVQEKWSRWSLNLILISIALSAIFLVLDIII